MRRYLTSGINDFSIIFLSLKIEFLMKSIFDCRVVGVNEMILAKLNADG